MKTKITQLIVLFAIGSINLFAQDAKPSIAVSNPNVNGLTTKSESVAKMTRLELIKMDKHIVLDEFDMGDVIKNNVTLQLLFPEDTYHFNASDRYQNNDILQIKS